MTTTRALVNAPTGSINVNLPVVAFANMVEASAQKGSNGVEESTYVLASGDENHPLRARISIYSNPGKNNGLGEQTVTLRLDFSATETDDTTGEVLIDAPASVSITTRMPGISPTFEEADYMAYVLAAASVFFQTVDGSTDPETTIVDKLKYGISALL